jgi:hypothetical protein
MSFSRSPLTFLSNVGGFILNYMALQLLFTVTAVGTLNPQNLISSLNTESEK